VNPIELAKKVARAIFNRLPNSLRGRFIFLDFIFPEHAAALGKNVRNLRVLIPAQRVKIACVEKDPLVPIGRFYRDGFWDRPNIFVCEVPEALFNVENGIVCTRDAEVLLDIEPRAYRFRDSVYRKPVGAKRLSGLYSSINYPLAGNHYHWTVDCLPKLHSLALAEPKRTVTILMPETLGPVHRESLEAVLPAHFRLEYRPAGEWLRVETFLLPSLVSGYCNGLLPAEYNDSIRRPVFRRYRLPDAQPRIERIYLTRRGANQRAVLNEDAVMALLEPYGFKLVDLGQLSFREQVELFHRADLLVGPSGAGFNLMMYCGQIDVVVLHPNRTPDNYFHAMAQGLGQKYHYVLHDGGVDDNLEVDLPALKWVLDEELGLRPGLVSRGVVASRDVLE
jgi:capsular polysaccharide biosynthesis protein